VGEGEVRVADATEEGRMRAIVHRSYGSPEVLESADVDRPVVGDDDVLVRVRAASVHPGDYFLMTGEPYVVRLAFGLRRPRHPIPGRDLAGVVAAVGKDVVDLQPGDEVFGWSTTGTLAEYACVPAVQLVRTPANLSAGQAAAVPKAATGWPRRGSPMNRSARYPRASPAAAGQCLDRVICDDPID
jgi:NADPH:quinone reductase-like Zn-dependent oxidoreductase